jgi:hypothetical protein
VGSGRIRLLNFEDRPEIGENRLSDGDGAHASGVVNNSASDRRR